MRIGMALLCTLIALSGCNKDKEQQQKQSFEKEQAEIKQRFERWAYIAKEKRITDTETVKLLVIPGNLDLSFTDTRCFIYTNAEYRTTNFVCPDASSENIAESAEYQ